MSALDDLRTLAKRPTETWIADLDRHTRAAAAIMTEIHGGEWKVTICHETFFVLICPKRDVPA